MHVVATAGHVDHGKSTLITALTGTNPDRWAEERRRGLTIDLGFAHMTLPSGSPVSFIDVPGHVRFVKNMLAGVGAVDACVFVVAATEGWKPQSEEHLRILELLGVRHGVVALTKVDLVEPERCELVHVELAERVAGTFLDGAEVVEVAAPSGAGTNELASAIDAMLAVTPHARDLGRPRLWVDRVFAARGSGTVVTGTLVAGALTVGDTLLVEPASTEVRVRALQTLNRPVDRIGPGNRVAVNLVGVEHRDVRRGDVLVEPGRWHRTSTVDASLHVLAALDHAVSRRGSHVLHLGSGEWPVRIRVLGDEALDAGATGFVRVHLPVALPLLPGDRYVLRESGRGETVGGGEVLDVAPMVKASRARPDRSVERVVRERRFVDVAELARLTGEAVAPTAGRFVVDPDVMSATADRLRTAVATSGPLGLDTAMLDELERAVLATVEGVTVAAGRARLESAADPLADHPFRAALATSPFSPPGADGVDRAALRELVRRGLVVERDGCWFHPDAIEAAAHAAARLLAAKPSGFTMAELRDALGTTRKHALPIANELDARGVTRRRGDVRIAGARLPAVEA